MLNRTRIAKAEAVMATRAQADGLEIEWPAPDASAEQRAAFVAALSDPKNGAARLRFAEKMAAENRRLVVEEDERQAETPSITTR